MNSFIVRSALAIVMLFAGAVAYSAQITRVHTTGLTKPIKLITAGADSLLVSEQGTTTPNTGRVSIISQSTGMRQTLLSGLPSGVNNLGGPPGPSGAAAILLSGTTLYLSISAGDTVQNVGGVELPDPDPPSSPIFVSVLEIELPPDWEQITSPFEMSMTDQNDLAAGSTVTLTNGTNQLTVRMVVDLPNYTPSPQPNAPGAVRSANLFGLEIDGRDLLVLDASQNDIKRVNIDTGASSVLVHFPARPNPLFGTLGGPFVDPVPTSIRRIDDQLVVSFLTGFPFAQGIADIRTVQLATGAHVGFISGLTSAIDVLQVPAGLTTAPGYYTLEFSTDQLANAPGRLRFYSSPNAAPRHVASLATPSSMARNNVTRDIFVTNTFPGTVTRLSFPTAPFDYDADGRSDISVFRPADGVWYLQRSRDNFVGTYLGNADDTIVPADYDGDSKTDVAVYRPSEGLWYFQNSGDGTYAAVRFGTAEDIPVPADHDGDGKADLTVFRPSSGIWYIRNSSDMSSTTRRFGTIGDSPVVPDFDGDGKPHVAVYRPSTSVWYHIKSTSGAVSGEQFGLSSDRIAPGDYDGDRKTDLAVFRSSEGVWYIKDSSTAAYRTSLFGLAGDIPVAADYDGDGKADVAVFRPADGYWYIANSASGSFTTLPWGQSGDRPTPAAFGNQ